MKPRPDLLSDKSPPGLEVFQLTEGPGVPSSHIYMEAQIFTPDSKRLVLHRSGLAHGEAYGTNWTSGITDPGHQFLVCDLESGGALSPIISEPGATSPAVSPDGSYLYYFVDETSPGKGRLIIKRVRLDGTERESVFTLDSVIPGTRFRACRPYVLSTISSDGARVALPVFLGDGKTEGAPFALLCFDVVKAAVSMVIHGPTFRNMHPQYSRSPDPDASHDILIQEDHGCLINAAGILTGYVDDIDDGDIHVIRDDGTSLRDMPWGRDGNEFVQGHQCWRGRSRRAITSTTTLHPKEYQLIEGEAAPHAGHIGIKTPGGNRNDLSRSFPNPYFIHFANDIAGRRLISDTGPGEGAVYMAELPIEPTGSLQHTQFLLSTGSSWRKDTHIHPFLSPDGSMGFFNSDESGTLQAFLVRGWQVT